MKDQSNKTRQRRITDTVKFRCRCILETVQQRIAENGNEYWIIKSKHGVRFLCFNQQIALECMKYIPNEECGVISGKLSFAPGSTFLVVEGIKNVLSADFETQPYSKGLFDYVYHDYMVV